MTQQQYISNGYLLSAAISQAVIDKAERDVKTAYILPIQPGASFESDTTARRAMMELSFLRILQSSIFASRAGAKIKLSNQSQIAAEDAQLAQTSETANMWLEKLKAEPGSNPNARVYDICKIYFKTNFIGV